MNQTEQTDNNDIKNDIKNELYHHLISFQKKLVKIIKAEER